MRHFLKSLKFHFHLCKRRSIQNDGEFKKVFVPNKGKMAKIKRKTIQIRNSTLARFKPSHLHYYELNLFG